MLLDVQFEVTKSAHDGDTHTDSNSHDSDGTCSEDFD